MAKLKIVLSTVPYEGEHLERLQKALGDTEFIHVKPDQHDHIANALERADVAILRGDLDERFLSTPGLRWIHCDHAGLNRSAMPQLFKTDLLVTSSAGRSAPALAEHALFFMLALAYNSPAFLGAQRAHQWGIPGQHELRGLYGRTVGILGMGNNGMELAVRTKACGMTALGYDRRELSLPSGVDTLYHAHKREDLETILQASDFLVVTLPLSDSTYHLIGEKEIELMKPSAFLINIGRGAVVDEKALFNALKRNRLAGAGLDTFSEEPLPEDSPLWDAANMLITPHVTPQVPDRTGRSLDIICENIRRYRADEPLLNLLTHEDVFTKERP